MPPRFLSRLSLLIIFGAGCFGCPGRDYFEKRAEERRTECLGYGGTWTPDAVCLPDFDSALQGQWQSECTADASASTWSRLLVEFKDNSVRYTQLNFASEACDSIVEQSEFTSEYSLSIETTATGRLLGQRRIFTKLPLPSNFSDLHTVKLLDLENASLLPRNIGVVRVTETP